MSADDPSSRMPWIEPDLDTVIRAGWILTALGIVIFVVSLAGELLGWWDLGGEIGMWIGALLTIVVGYGTTVTTASRDQVAGIDDRIRSVHTAVETNGVKLDKLDRLDHIQWALDEQTGVLTQIRDRL